MSVNPQRSSVRSTAWPPVGPRVTTIVWIGIAAVAFLLLLPGLIYGPSQDAAVYTEVADRLRAGVLPYAGAWDHKPPVVYLLYALTQEIMPFLGPWTSVWLLSWATVVLCGALTARLVRRSGLPSLAIPAAACVVAALSLPPIAQGGGHTEPVGTAFALGALILVLEPRRWWSQLLAGALFGMAMMATLQAAPVAAAALIMLRPDRHRWRLAAFVVGVAGVLVLTATSLAILGILPAAFDAVFVYSAAYREMNLGFQGPLLEGAIRAGILVAAPFLFPVGVGVLRSFRLLGAQRILALACLGWLVVGVTWIWAQGRIEGHYLVPLLPAAAFLVVLGAEHLVTIGRGNPVVAGSILSLTSAAVVLSALVVVRASDVVWGELRAENGRAQAVAALLSAEGSRAGTVFVWGNRPQVYFYAKRVPANRYFYLAPLTTPGYSRTDQVQVLADQLRSSLPAYFVDAGSPSPGAPGLSPLLLARPITANGRDFDALDPVRRLVRQDYQLAEVVKGWPVYRRIR